MTPTLCAIIASEGIPAFGRNETDAIIIMCAGKSVFKSPNRAFCLRCGSAGHLPGETLSSPTTQQLSRGLGSGAVNNREADVPPPSRSLLAEAAVAGNRVNNQVETANKQREEENNHSDGKQQALVCLPCIKSHVVPHTRLLLLSASPALHGTTTGSG